ncbi:hypothetical protein EDD53_0913 [Pacificibacter maritimus]|uniref:Uncharacterized protein n=1 Tax=Pacificibacter maritimus TaxID=762213 RepID=A0A3N4USV0_9RHOB|nr:hypothetical protein [Pacificibacter maritimus]RPE71785.1 hypothetical protein EDD53_0913 [Pacificibacter maritimus]
MKQFDPRLSGAAPVSRVDTIDQQSLLLITALRKFGQSDEHLFWENISSYIGPQRGDTARAYFDDLMQIFTRYARRPLMTHDGNCNCIGADEANFALFICTATHGDAEDAMLQAMLILRPDVVPSAVNLAQQLGLMMGNVMPMPVAQQSAHHYH